MKIAVRLYIICINNLKIKPLITASKSRFMLRNSSFKVDLRKHGAYSNDKDII